MIEPGSPADAVVLEARGLHKYFGKGDSRVHALRGVSLSIRRGEFLAVMGPSGCGKSTLLHLLGLMTPPDDGSVMYDGKAVTTESQRSDIRRRRLGFVFQRFNLIGVLTARANIEISLHVRGLPRSPRIEELMDELGIAQLAQRKPSQMSIGQQQRLAVVRALAHQPQVVLADEPTGNLDTANSSALLETLKRINRCQGQTLVMITHSQEAAAFADRVLHMRDGLILGQD